MGDRHPPPELDDGRGSDQAILFAPDSGRLQPVTGSLSHRLQDADLHFKILIVDDEPSLRRLLVAVLGMANYGLLEAGTGHEGLHLARTCLPDLILLDVHLPDMSGLEVCAQLKSDLILCNIPVVLLTGASSDEDREAGLAVEAAYYLTKPFTPPQLLKAIRQLLAQDA